MDKTKGEGGSKGGRWVWLGWGGHGGDKMQTTVIEQRNVICGKKINKISMSFKQRNKKRRG